MHRGRAATPLAAAAGPAIPSYLSRLQDCSRARVRFFPCMRPTRLFPTLALFLPASVVLGQADRPTGRINETYTQLCANCHGKNLEGGQAQSLLDDTWVAGGDDESLAKSIRNGFPDKGMPAWGAAIPEKEIRAMVIYIHEQRSKHQREQTQFTKPADSITAKSKLHTFKL